MQHDLTHAAQHLGRNHLLSLWHAAGRRVECLRGSLWITLDNDRRDIILGAGEGFTIDRPERAVVTAFEDSDFLLLDAGTPHAPAATRY